GYRIPDSEFQIPKENDSGIRDLESGIWNLESGIWNPSSVAASAALDSDSVPSPRRARIVPVTEFQIPNSQFQKRTIRESEIWNLESEIWNPSSVAASAALGLRNQSINFQLMASSRTKQ